MKPYYDYTEGDRIFYQKYLKPRLPKKIYDIHVHINLQEHIQKVPPSRWNSDWALECGHLLPYNDACKIFKELFPDSNYSFAGFPWPIREADLKSNNQYLSQLNQNGLLSSFMCVKPEWNLEEIEELLVAGNFVGFKPYPDMVSGKKGADIKIFDFLPHEQWKILDTYKKAVMLHLPRAGRLPDDENIRELLIARDKYPNVIIIIAHFGRSFCPVYLEEGLKKLGNIDEYYFDTSAVINPEVYDIAFNSIKSTKILYGSDMPITSWHGKREWTERTYTNLCREEYSWNVDRRKPEEENAYTLFIYEEMKSILDALERNGLGEEHKMNIFYKNAKKILPVA